MQRSLRKSHYTNSTAVVVWYPYACCISNYLLYKVGKGSSQNRTSWTGCYGPAIPYVVRKNWASTPSASRSYGRLAGEIRLDFEILTILYRLNYLDFYFLYSSAMLLIVLEVYFSLLFSNKADFRVCFVARKIRSLLFFMSIPTIRY